MKLLRKICVRLTDPVFYRKLTRDFIRGFRSFEDAKASRSLAQIGEVVLAVIVVAHPDDEVFCSGLICEMKEQGVRVRVLCLTKGEGGPCDVLGVDELVFLGHIDPVGRGFKVFAPEVAPADLASQILPHLDGADLVVSHGSGGEYWHPAHLLIFEAVKEAVARYREEAATWLTFSARQADHPLPELVNWDDPAFLTLDGARHERLRLKALDCHRTQLGLFSKFARGEHADFIKLTSREAYALQHRGRSFAASKIAEAADESEGERDHRGEG